MAPEKFRARHGRPDHTSQRMTDIGGAHISLPEPGFLEGEDAEQLLHITPDLANPALTPRPRLWRHQIDDGNVHPFQSLGQPQIEIGAVDEDRYTRFLPA